MENEPLGSIFAILLNPKSFTTCGFLKTLTGVCLKDGRESPFFFSRLKRTQILAEVLRKIVAMGRLVLDLPSW